MAEGQVQDEASDKALPNIEVQHRPVASRVREILETAYRVDQRAAGCGADILGPSIVAAQNTGSTKPLAERELQSVVDVITLSIGLCHIGEFREGPQQLTCCCSGFVQTRLRVYQSSQWVSNRRGKEFTAALRLRRVRAANIVLVR